VSASAGETARAEAARWVAEVRAARLQSGWPRSRLATALGVEAATVRSWEAGRRIPTLPNLIIFGHEFGMRLVIIGRDGRAVPARTPPVADEPLAHQEIRGLVAALRGERRRRELSQDALAAEVGVSTWSLTMFERGKLHSRPAVLAAWSAALECSVRWRLIV
jgi:transcriptional regulator with XRE-family HTH domain